MKQTKKDLINKAHIKYPFLTKKGLSNSSKEELEKLLYHKEEGC